MEEWKDIPGYEGLYQASNEGRIRTTDGKTTFTQRHGTRVWKQKILRQKCNANGKGRKDFRIELWKDGVHKTYLVSRLVALTWCDGYQDGMTVNHIDGNQLNNKAENLEWLSLGDNIRHGFKTGLYPTKKCTLIDEDGNKISFQSESKASIWLGRDDHYITCCLSKNRKALSINGTTYSIART